MRVQRITVIASFFSLSYFYFQMFAKTEEKRQERNREHWYYQRE
jgi:hypothetical protein